MNLRMRSLSWARLVKLARLSSLRTLIAEPHLNLIKPVTVNVSEMKDYLMIGVTQEGGAGLHREREYPIHL